MIKIIPFFSQRPWAGKRMQQLFPAAPAGTGETWILSTLDNCQSFSEGKSLSEVLGKKLSFIVKVIDTSASLSVQVHPNDEWANKLENSKGKSECWLILSAEKGAGVYLGLKSGVERETFEAAIRNAEDVSRLMNFHAVEKNDFISVPAGTIHAIGANVTLIEVQQASGITYRLWDWNRTGRELHVDKGMMVADFESRPEIKKAKDGILLTHPDFEVRMNDSETDGWSISLEDFTLGEKKNPYLFVR
ncbi:MAG: type I phosphomannose isomerase catalytic subunit [Bdellovibrionota bacterium]